MCSYYRLPTNEFPLSLTSFHVLIMPHGGSLLRYGTSVCLPECGPKILSVYLPGFVRVLLMIIKVPAQVGSDCFVQYVGIVASSHCHVVLKAILADVLRQRLQIDQSGTRPSRREYWSDHR